MSSDQRQTVAGTAVRLEELSPAKGSAGLRDDQVARLHDVHVRTERRAPVLHGGASRNVLVLRLAETHQREAHVRDHSRGPSVQAVLRPGVQPPGESGGERSEDAGHLREGRRDVCQTEIRRDVRRARRPRFGLVDVREVQPSLDISIPSVLEQLSGRLFRQIRMRRNQQVARRRPRLRG